MVVTSILRKFRGRRRGATLAVLALATMSAGCSADRIFGSSSQPASNAGSSASASVPASSSSSSVTGRLADFFSPKSSSTSSTSPSQTASVNPFELVCPGVDVRQGASTLTIPPGDTNAFALRYQGTISEMARECKVTDGVMRIKVGIQGRILLGPAGGPGALEVPLRYAVVQEGPEPKTIVSKFYKVPVTIPEGRPNVPFMHIDEDVSFPMPTQSEAIMSYVVYVGFDPIGEKQQPAKKPAPKPAPKPVPARPR